METKILWAVCDIWFCRCCRVTTANWRMRSKGPGNDKGRRRDEWMKCGDGIEEKRRTKDRLETVRRRRGRRGAALTITNNPTIKSLRGIKYWIESIHNECWSCERWVATRASAPRCLGGAGSGTFIVSVGGELNLPQCVLDQNGVSNEWSQLN